MIGDAKIVIASEAKQTRVTHAPLGCFAALAMTITHKK